MTAVTVNSRFAQNPAPNMEVVDVTAAATGATFKSKFANIDGALMTLHSSSGTVADLKLDYTTTAGTVAITTGGTATRGTLVIFGH